MTEEHVRPSIVYVEWVDSGSTHGWVHLDQLRDPPRILCVTVGFLVREIDEGVTVSASWSDTGSFDSPITIPWATVTKYHTVEFS